MGELGAVVEGWAPPPRPGPERMDGRFVRLERLSAARHGAALHAAFATDDAIWRYMPYGPFADAEAFGAWAEKAEASADPYYYTILDEKGPAGVASYLRITPEHGVIEVGAITYAPRLQRRPAATEAMALMAAWAFGAGYRRYEWKCNALNGPSRRAAERLGFSFEGLFRKHMIQKGRNRDTAWFAMTEDEWPALAAAHARWLDPRNFDAEGRQRETLGALTAPHRLASDPTLRR